MEYLEFLNLDNTTHKKCSKVRSWYLYEQFKSLERDQLDAAKKLKERSLQEKFLLQELQERRERRRFCEKGGGGECITSDLPGDDPMDLDVVDSKDNLFSVDGSESPLSSRSRSPHSTHYVVQAAGRHFEEDSHTTAEVAEKEPAESSCDGCPAPLQEPLALQEEDTPSEADLENIDVNNEPISQLETVLEEIENLQTYSKMYEEVKSSDLSSNEACDAVPFEGCYKKKTAVATPPDPSAAVFIWTKLVSFAYQIMQLYHGNCYYDYSTQILTAILACDILRRGLCKMSDYLQPYTCPAKLPDEPVYVIEKQTKMKNKIYRKNNCEPKKSSLRSEPRLQKRFTRRKACSEYRYRDVSYNWTDDTKVRRHSEPWRQPCHTCQRGCSCYRTRYRSLCRCCKHTINPMMKLSHFINKVVSEIMSSSSRENL